MSFELFVTNFDAFGDVALSHNFHISEFQILSFRFLRYAAKNNNKQQFSRVGFGFYSEMYYFCIIFVNQSDIIELTIKNEH